MESKLKSFLSNNKFLLLISLADFLLIYLSSFNKDYGYFIDEFYYIACAKRPAFGYVDHPPFAPFVLTLFGSIFGYSIYAIRILPALAAAATTFLSGHLTKKLDGSESAQFIASLATMCVPILLGMSGFYSMNAFEPLLSLIAIILIVKIINSGNLKLWLIVGLVFGLGMMNKHTFFVIILAILFSLIISGKWKLIFNKWFLYCGIIALIIFIPNVIWQAVNDFPSLEFYRNITKDKNVYTPPFEFIINQIIQMSPFTLPLWLGGTIYFLISKKYSQYKFIPIFFILTFAFFLISGTSRSDRSVYAYPVIFSAGAILFSTLSNRKFWKLILPVYSILLLAGTAVIIPVILPYFSYETVKAHTELLGLNTEIEVGKKPPLPQILADRIGWEEKVALVLKAYNSLTPEEKSRAIVTGDNYGQAGAIELYGEGIIPYVVSSHNNYFLWSKGKVNGDILVEITDASEYEDYLEVFGSVEKYGNIFKSDYVSGHENNLQVFICREPKVSFDKLLEESKNYH